MAQLTTNCTSFYFTLFLRSLLDPSRKYRLHLYRWPHPETIYNRSICQNQYKIIQWLSSFTNRALWMH